MNAVAVLLIAWAVLSALVLAVFAFVRAWNDNRARLAQSKRRRGAWFAR